MSSDIVDAGGNYDKRSKTYRDLVNLTPDKVMDRIDGVDYEYKVEPQCRVCTADPRFRDLVDTYLSAHRTLRDTQRAVQSIEEDLGVQTEITYWSIRNHLKKHLPVERVMARELVERKASERGMKVMEGTGSLLTAEAVLQLIVERGWENLTNGDDTPAIKDTIAAAVNLRKLEQAAEQVQEIEELKAQFAAAWELVQDVITDEQREVLAEKLKRLQGN